MNASYVRATQFAVPGILYVIDGAGGNAGGNRINSLTLESFQSALRTDARIQGLGLIQWLRVWPRVKAFWLRPKTYRYNGDWQKGSLKFEGGFNFGDEFIR